MFNNKNSIKLFLLSFVFLLTLNATAYPIMCMPTADDVVNKMKADLALTDEQVEQIKPVINDHIRQVNELMGNIQETPETARSAMECIHNRTKLKLTPFLTDDQMKKLH